MGMSLNKHGLEHEHESMSSMSMGMSMSMSIMRSAHQRISASVHEDMG
jgi:hypothetical protein